MSGGTTRAIMVEVTKPRTPTNAKAALQFTNWPKYAVAGVPTSVAIARPSITRLTAVIRRSGDERSDPEVCSMRQPADEAEGDKAPEVGRKRASDIPTCEHRHQRN
jgi:hypothetical protein